MKITVNDKTAATDTAANRQMPELKTISQATTQPEEQDLGGPVDPGMVYCFAEAGDVDAQVWLGLAHLVGRHAPKDPKEAMKWLTRAARQGHVCAQRHVGQAYLTGTGVKKNLKQAGVWLSRAAKQQCNCAQLAIAAGCLKGKPLPKACKIMEHGCTGE